MSSRLSSRKNGSRASGRAWLCTAAFYHVAGLNADPMSMARSPRGRNLGRAQQAPHVTVRPAVKEWRVVCKEQMARGIRHPIGQGRILPYHSYPRAMFSLLHPPPHSFGIPDALSLSGSSDPSLRNRMSVFHACERSSFCFPPCSSLGCPVFVPLVRTLQAKAQIVSIVSEVSYGSVLISVKGTHSYSTCELSIECG